MPTLRLILSCLFLALLAACGGGGGSSGAPPPPPSPPPPALALALREVASVAGAVFATAPAGDSRLFIVERDGLVRIVQNGQLLPAPFLDISTRVSTSGEGGLLSMAFDPDFARNGFFYLYYTDLARNIVIERGSVSPAANLADPLAYLEIIRIAHPGYTNHYGGLVAFGPDGMLYLGTGDGGGAGDPNGNGQHPDALLGKLLRIDVRSAGSAVRYLVPSGNPFVGQAGRRPEIWALGLRNPWRFAFDSSGLYIADVGQGRREEVDIAALAAGGLNYGWNTMEGTLCYNAATCNQAGLTMPAFEYDHGSNNVNGCSITGGYVYRGKALPELAGNYFYSDYCLGFLKSFVSAATGVGSHRDWHVGSPGRIVSFGHDADGELYLIADSGKVLKIVRAAP
jgi:glucose/arabinose dehydrogenase